MYVSGADRRITTHCMYKRLNSISMVWMNVADVEKLPKYTSTVYYIIQLEYIMLIITSQVGCYLNIVLFCITLHFA